MTVMFFNFCLSTTTAKQPTHIAHHINECCCQQIAWYDHQARDPRMRITLWVMLMTQRTQDDHVLRGSNGMNAPYDNEAGCETGLSWLGPLGP
jgi:hypothetical protein